MLAVDLNLSIQGEEVGEDDEEEINPNSGGRDIDLNFLPLEEHDSVEELVEIDLSSLPWEEDGEDQTQAEVEVMTENTFSGNDENLHQLEASIGTSRRRYSYLSNNDRQLVLNMLLAESKDGKLKKNGTRRVASHFSINMKTVQRIWRRYKMDESVTVSRKVGNCGRKRILFNPEEIRQIPLCRRKTIRSFACALNFSKRTLHRHFKREEFRRHSCSLKPLLTDENKVSRLKFCISMLEEDSIPNEPTFKAIYNVIHIDEKWFYMRKKEQHYYLLPDEEDPLQTCKNKNYIQRVMFLVALARPRFDENGVETFSGKIGLFPFVVQEPARRRSANRPAGTLVTKPITSVSREVIRSYFIEKLLPAIKEKWPIEDQSYPIIIQQDNARPHLDEFDYLLNQAARSLGLDIQVLCQPPNSPDLNVLDLGFFNAIQSLQYKEAPKDVNELVSVVERTFEAYPSKMSNRIFLSLQLSMIEIMKAKGCNKHQIPHINKEKLEREGNLPTQLKCESTLVQELLHYLCESVM